MAVDRNEAAWYYRLGEQTLGPVPWTEIEALIGDSAEAYDLLVARGGEQTWRSAAEVLAAHPELTRDPVPAPEGAPAPPAEEAPAHVRVGPGAVPIEFGIGRWITQAWEVVISDLWAWVGAVALVFLVGGLTMGIAAMPMTVGLYMMALRRFAGHPVGAGDVFLGFQRFWSAIGLWLLMAVPMTVRILPFAAIVLLIVAGSQSLDERVMPFLIIGFWAIYPILWLVMLGVQTIFFWSAVLVADGHGAWEAIVLSWEKVRTQFWSYLGMFVLLTVVAGIGANACYVGLFLTWPLMPCATVAAYRWHFRRQ